MIFSNFVYIAKYWNSDWIKLLVRKVGVFPHILKYNSSCRFLDVLRTNRSTVDGILAVAFMIYKRSEGRFTYIIPAKSLIRSVLCDIMKIWKKSIILMKSKTYICHNKKKILPINNPLVHLKLIYWLFRIHLNLKKNLYAIEIFFENCEKWTYCYEFWTCFCTMIPYHR